MSFHRAPCERPNRREAAPPRAETANAGAADAATRRAVLLAAILGSSIAFVDGSIVAVALPSIRADLGMTIEGMQWVVNGYALMLAAFILPAGAAGDVFGRRRVFLVGTVVYTLASLWCGLAGSGASLVAARIVEGAGGAFLVPASLALITVNIPRAERGRAIGLWAAAGAISGAIGPIAGGAIVDALSWRWALLLTVPFGALTFWIAWRGVPESRDPHASHMDWTGGVLAALGLAGLAYALTAFRDAPTLAILVGMAGVAGLLLFVWWQRRAREPMVPLALFREGAFAGANALTLLLYGALAAVMFLLPMTLIDAYNYSATMAGLSLVPATVVIGVLSRFMGGVADRTGPRRWLMLGPTIVGLALVYLAWTGADGLWTSVAPAMAGLGLGMGLTVAPLSTTVMNAAPDGKAGTASGINNAVSRTAGLLAVAGLGLAARAAFAATGAPGAFGEPANETTDGAAGAAYADAMVSGLSAAVYASAALCFAAALVAWWLVPDEGAPVAVPATG